MGVDISSMLATLISDITSVCDESSPSHENRRAHAPRRVPRLTVQECAVELLTIECECQ